MLTMISIVAVEMCRKKFEDLFNNRETDDEKNEILICGNERLLEYVLHNEYKKTHKCAGTESKKKEPFRFRMLVLGEKEKKPNNTRNAGTDYGNNDMERLHGF